MAEENQELQRMAEELRNSFQGLNTATKDANVGLDAFKKELKTVPGQLAKGLGGLASTVARGDTGIKSMTAVVDVAANAISGLAKTVPIFGEAMSAATKAIAEGAKIVVEQLDATAKTFNAMSASGALVADGMTGLSRQFTTAGLNLQQFQKVVGQNAVALARFRGVAGEGAEEFSKAVGNLTQKQDTDLRKIGMSAEDIAGTTAAFVTQQTRLGKSQSMSTEQLTAGAKQYALELDQLSKVTGMSREAIQKQQDAALSESKFRANYELAMQSGNEEQIRGAKGMMTLQTRMQSFGAELGQGVRDLSAGVANTEASQKLLNSTGGAALDIINRLKAGSIDQDQAQQELNDAYQKNKQAQLQIASQIGGTANVYADTAQMADFGNAMQKGAYEKAKQTQDAQINKTDDLTNSTVKAQQNLEKMNVEFSKMAINLMPAAADAIESMTGAMLKMVEWANEQFGPSTPGAKEAKAAAARANSAGGAVGTSAGGGATIVGGAGGENDAGAIMEAQAAAAAAKPSPPKPAAAPAAGGSAPPSGPTVDKSKESAPVAGGLFKGKSLDGVNPGLVDALTQAVMAYGKPVTVTSAVRSMEDQQRLYNDYISGRSPYPAAKPGQSKHGAGNAVDLNSADADALAAGGFLAQFGLGRPVKGDPVHIQQISAANGAILSGPTDGYQPNLTMHGTEAIVPLNSPAAESMGVGGGENTSLMAAQLEKLEEMVSVMKNQLDVSRKIMQYAS
jgi:hypothetical protein